MAIPVEDLAMLIKGVTLMGTPGFTLVGLISNLEADNKDATYSFSLASSTLTFASNLLDFVPLKEMAEFSPALLVASTALDALSLVADTYKTGKLDTGKIEAVGADLLTLTAVLAAGAELAPLVLAVGFLAGIAASALTVASAVSGNTSIDLSPIVNGATALVSQLRASASDTLDTLSDGIVNAMSSAAGTGASIFSALQQGLLSSGVFSADDAGAISSANWAAASGNQAINPFQGAPEIKNILAQMFGNADSVDPLVIDLSGTGTFSTVPISAGVHFDLTNSGFAESTAWLGSNTGLLVIAPPGTTTVTSDAQLIGSVASLAQYDSNGDGIIDANDAIWQNLQVWVDSNSDGVTEAGELVPIASLGIKSISLTPSNVGHTDANGVTVNQTISFTNTDGSAGLIGSLTLPTNPVDAIPDAVLPETSSIANLPNLSGSGTVYDLRQAMVRDSALTNLVQQLSNSTSYADFKANFDTLLFQWVGAASLAPASRGPDVNAQHLAVLEAFGAQKYSGATGLNPDGSLPNYASGPMLEDAYQALAEEYMWRFLAQSQFSTAWNSLDVLMDDQGTLTADPTALASAFAIVEGDPTSASLQAAALFAWTVKASGLFTEAETAPYFANVDVLGSTVSLDYSKSSQPFILEFGSDLDQGNNWHHLSMQRDLAGHFTVVDSWGTKDWAGNIQITGTKTLLDASNVTDAVLSKLAIVMGDGTLLTGDSLLSQFVLMGTTDAEAPQSETLTFQLGDGPSIINQNKAVGAVANTLQFGQGILPGDLTFTQINDDLVIVLSNGTDSITVPGYFLARQNQFTSISFADGETLGQSDVPFSYSLLLGPNESEASQNFAQPQPVTNYTFEAKDLPYWSTSQFSFQRDLLGNLNVVDTYGSWVGSSTETLASLSNLTDAQIKELRFTMLDGTVLTGDSLFSNLTRVITDGTASSSEALIFNLGDGANVVNQIKAAGSALNTLTFGSGISAGDLRFTQVNNDLVIALNNGTDSITVQGYFLAPQDQFASISFSDGSALDMANLPLVRLLGYAESTVNEDFSKTGQQTQFQVETSSLPWYATSQYAFQKDLNGNVEIADETDTAVAGSFTLFNGTNMSDSAIKSLSIRMPDGSVLTGAALYAQFFNGTTNATGSQSDHLVFNLGDGANVVNQVKPAGSALNTLTFGAGISAGDLRFTQVGNDLVIALSDGTDSITVQGYFLAPQDQFASITFSDGSTLNPANISPTMLLGPNESEVTQDFSNVQSVTSYRLEALNLPWWSTSQISFQRDLLGNLNVVDTYGPWGGGSATETLLAGSKLCDAQLRALQFTMLDGSVLTGSSLFSDLTRVVTDGTAAESEALTFNVGDGANVVNQNKDWGAAQNTLQFGTGIHPSDVTYTRSGSDLLISVGKGQDSITVQGYFSGNPADQFAMVKFADGSTLRQMSVTDSDTGNLEVLAMNGATLLQAGSGTETLDTTAAGNETVLAGSGNDTLNIEGGSHLVAAGTGPLTIFNSAIGGSETLALNRQSGSVAYTDYTGGSTALNLSMSPDIGESDVTVRLTAKFDSYGDSIPTDGYWETDLDVSVTGGPTFTIASPNLAGETTLPSISFGDGTTWSASDVMQQLEPQISSDGLAHAATAAAVTNGSAPTIATTNTVELFSLVDSDVIFGGANLAQLTATAGHAIIQGDGGNTAISAFDNASWSMNSAGQWIDTPAPDLVDGGRGTTSIAMADGIVLAQGGSSTMNLSGKNEVLLFDKGDGVDTVNDWAQETTTISLGGGLSWGDIAVEQAGNDLVLDIGSSGKIDLQNYFQNPGAAVQLQMFEGSDSAGIHAQTANLASIVSAFTAAGPQSAPWSLDSALTNLALTAETNQAYGGDIAAYYAMNGTLGGMSTDVGQAVLKDPAFGTAQTLTDPTQWQHGKYQLVA